MKNGDTVSVLDDDLRGVITSVRGNIVTIKDSHGFTHQYPKEQLVLVNTNLYENIKVEKKFEYSKPKSKKHSDNRFVLDLHFDKIEPNSDITDSFERLFIQKDKLLKSIDFCRKHRIKKMEIIHGIGDGVLQKMVWDVLKAQINLDFYNNDILHHQTGSVIVEFH